MDTERAQERPYVVPRRFVGNTQPPGDLLRLEALAEKPERLELAGRELRPESVVRGRCPIEWHPDAEDPDDGVAAAQRSRADPQPHQVASRVAHEEVVHRPVITEKLAREVRTREVAVLGSDDAFERLSEALTDQSDPGSVEPLEPPVAADHVRRCGELLESAPQIELRAERDCVVGHRSRPGRRRAQGPLSESSGHWGEGGIRRAPASRATPCTAAVPPRPRAKDSARVGRPRRDPRGSMRGDDRPGCGGYPASPTGA